MIIKSIVISIMLMTNIFSYDNVPLRANTDINTSTFTFQDYRIYNDLMSLLNEEPQSKSLTIDYGVSLGYNAARCERVLNCACVDFTQIAANMAAIYPEGADRRSLLLKAGFTEWEVDHIL